MVPLMSQELSISENPLHKKKIHIQESFWVIWTLRELDGQKLQKSQEVTSTFQQEDISGKLKKTTYMEQVTELDTFWESMKDQWAFQNITKQFLNQT